VDYGVEVGGSLTGDVSVEIYCLFAVELAEMMDEAELGDHRHVVSISKHLPPYGVSVLVEVDDVEVLVEGVQVFFCESFRCVEDFFDVVGFSDVVEEFVDVWEVARVHGGRDGLEGVFLSAVFGLGLKTCFYHSLSRS